MREERGKERVGIKGDRGAEGRETVGECYAIWMKLPPCLPLSSPPGQKCPRCYSSSWRTLQDPSWRQGFSSKCVLEPALPRTLLVNLEER